MDIIDDINTYLSLQHKDRNRSFPNEFIFIYAMPGFGKTLTMETIIEEYHKRGYVILVLSDVKDEFEFGYAMFKPEKPYHLDHLRKIGKPIQTKKVRLYHPFTFNIPKGYLPDINFYGFNLKDLRRSEWSMLCESSWESDTIRLLLNASNSMGDSDGLIEFLHSIQNLIFGKRKGKEKSIKSDPGLFHLRTTGGTVKSLQDVASYFLPFKKHLFLISNNSPLNLDWRKILSDNEHYHVFGTRWLDDEKLKEFCILALFNAILRNRRYTKKPCLIIIPEIRFLVPIRPRGYKEFLAKGMTLNISVMRNIGKGGNSGLFDSQVWMDVDESVKNSATVSFIGKLGGAKDIEAITKAMRYKSETIQQITNPEYERSYILQNNPTRDTWIFWLPGHCHAEEEYDFFDLYKQHFRDKMKDYKSLIEMIKKKYSESEKKIKERIKAQDRTEKEEEERERKEKEKRIEEKTGVEEKIKKAEEIQKESKEQLMRLCYEMFIDEKLDKKERTYRKIGEKFKIHHATAKDYVNKYEKKLKEGGNNTFPLPEGNQ
jgi:hypothetical protein